MNTLTSDIDDRNTKYVFSSKGTQLYTLTSEMSPLVMPLPLLYPQTLGSICA